MAVEQAAAVAQLDVEMDNPGHGGRNRCQCDVKRTTMSHSQNPNKPTKPTKVGTSMLERKCPFDLRGRPSGRSTSLSTVPAALHLEDLGDMTVVTSAI